MKWSWPAWPRRRGLQENTNDDEIRSSALSGLESASEQVTADVRRVAPAGREIDAGRDSSSKAPIEPPSVSPVLDEAGPKLEEACPAGDAVLKPGEAPNSELLAEPPNISSGLAEDRRPLVQVAEEIWRLERRVHRAE